MAELRVHIDSTGLHLSGVVSPPRPTRTALHRSESELDFVSSVANGRFAFDSIARGLVRLAFEDRNRPDVWTDWFRV